MEAIHGLLAGNGKTSDRLAVVALDKLTPSAFYNMLADGKPVEKALALLHFTLRGNGKQHAHGFRVVTERVQDATAEKMEGHFMPRLLYARSKNSQIFQLLKIQHSWRSSPK